MSADPQFLHGAMDSGPYSSLPEPTSNSRQAAIQVICLVRLPSSRAKQFQYLKVKFALWLTKKTPGIKPRCKEEVSFPVRVLPTQLPPLYRYHRGNFGTERTRIRDSATQTHSRLAPKSAMMIGAENQGQPALESWGLHSRARRLGLGFCVVDL